MPSLSSNIKLAQVITSVLQSTREMETVLSLSNHAKAPQADPKDFFDNGSLKELEDSGFVKKLYSRR